MMRDSMSDCLRWRRHAGAAILTVALLLLAGGAWAQVSPGAPPAAAAAPPALTATDLTAFMDGLIPYAIQGGDIAGAVVSVVANGQIIFAKGYGVADMKTRRPVVPDQTLFRVASISKLFTWTAVMQLVQAGKLDLDRDINDYLDFKVPERFGPITLRNLMTHTAGFEETFSGGLAPSASKILPYREYLVKHIPPQIFPPGKIVAYSNYGATLAGYIVQRVSGEPFAEYIAHHILQPLGMTHSTFQQPPPPALLKDLSRGYMKASDDKPVPFVYSNIAPAGALSTTAIDMAHFMIAQLQGGSYDGASIMSPATTQLMHTPQSRMAPGMNGFDLGFYQENRNGLRIIGHGGDLYDFHSDLHLLLDKDVGLFVSFNTEGKDVAAITVRDALFHAFLDRYYPYTPPVEPTLLHSQADAARVAGWYIPSIQWQSSGIKVVEGLSQVHVIALPSGEIEMSPLLRNIAGAPEHWREVGPLRYREVGGQEHLKFVTDSDGHVTYWISDHLIPVSVFMRVHGLEQNSEINWIGGACLAILLLTVVIWVGGAIVRRRFKTPLLVTLQEKRLRLASRVGAVLMLVIVCAWEAFFAVVNDNRGSTTGLVTILYIVGVLGFLGALAVLAEAIRRVLRGPGGWLVRSGEVLLGLCALYGIWFILFFGLANFNYHY